MSGRDPEQRKTTWSRLSYHSFCKGKEEGQRRTKINNEVKLETGIALTAQARFRYLSHEGVLRLRAVSWPFSRLEGSSELGHHVLIDKDPLEQMGHRGLEHLNTKKPAIVKRRRDAD